MLEQFTRWLVHQSIEMQCIPDTAPRQSFGSVVSDLISICESKKAVWIINKEANAVRLSKVKIDRENKIAFLLLTYADKNIADPAFADLDSGTIRIEGKLEGEGVAVSAHMAVDLVDRHKVPFVNNVVVEDVPGLGRTKIEPFLTYLFRKSCRLECDNGEGGVLKFRPSVSMSGRMSDRLRDDLSAGKLSFVELIRFQESGDKFDIDPELKIDRAVLRLRVVDEVGGKTAIDLLNRIMPKARKSGYTDIKVSWHENSGKNKTKEFGTAREDAGDVLTFKTERVTTEVPIAQCEEDFREEIVGALRSAIISAREYDANS